MSSGPRSGRVLSPIDALSLSLSQLGDPAFIKVLVRALLLAVLLIIAIGFGLEQFLPERAIYEVGEGDDSWWAWAVDLFGDWLVDAADIGTSIGYWLLVSATAVLLFPAIMTGLMGIFLDDIINAVEDKHYPHSSHRRQHIDVFTAIKSALGLLGAMLLLHGLALIPYLILLLTTGGLGVLALALAINGYLLGREFFDMVALRYMSGRENKAAFRANRQQIWFVGLMVAGCFSIPFVNLIAPILGAAIMTHMVHAHVMVAQPYGR